MMCNCKEDTYYLLEIKIYKPKKEYIRGIRIEMRKDEEKPKKSSIVN